MTKCVARVYSVKARFKHTNEMYRICYVINNVQDIRDVLKKRISEREISAQMIPENKIVWAAVNLFSFFRRLVQFL
jgi:hypothetical protein